METRIQKIDRTSAPWMVLVPVMIGALLWIAAPAAAAPLPGESLTDLTITDAVEDELAQDFVVPGDIIDVRTDDGNVTLTGAVNNILARQRAERIARTVKGVRMVENRIVVLPADTFTDQEIRKNVKSALLVDPATDAYELEVEVTNGVVTLSGKVDSWQERRLAGKVAKGVRGVVALQNDVLVTDPIDRPDPEIQADISQALAWNAFIDDNMIAVEVDDGNVTLSGVVGSAAEKSRAIVNAWVQGVRTVNADNLEVERWARDEELRRPGMVQKTDPEIEQAVEDALLLDPRVGSYNVQVSVDDHVATLRGTVGDLAAKRAADRTAKDTMGVVRVENRLKVRPEETVQGETLSERIKDALLIDPFVSRYEISVIVDNGIARLYGTVDSFYEKAQADEVASGVKGVVAVDNNLIVDQAYDPLVYDPYVDEWSIYDYNWYDYQPGATFVSDAEIVESIESEFFWSPFVDGGDITISVEDGVATLTGEVDSWAERYAARENALEGGATWVDNELRVE